MSEHDDQNHAAHEHNSEAESHGHSNEKGTVTLSANDFTALEERVMRAVEVVRRERQMRIAAEERATQAETKLHEQEPVLDQLEKEVSLLRAERDHVRERVERLLGQLDALEL